MVVEPRYISLYSVIIAPGERSDNGYPITSGRGRKVNGIAVVDLKLYE